MVINIIIPVYNAEKFLERCLDSVLAQTYGNWRAIIVDDGSTDQSGAIADAYQQKDERFFVIHKKNEGQSRARLDGICAANGDVVMFLDGDDYWPSCCLEKIINVFHNHDADIVMFPARVVEEDGSHRRIIGQVAENSGFVSKQVIYEKLIGSHDLNSLCLKALKRTVFDLKELESTADKAVRMAEDKLMLLPLITKASKVYYLSDVLYVYVHYEQSTSHYYRSSRISEMIAKPVFLETYRYMTVWGLDDKRYKTMLGTYYLKNLMACYYQICRYCADEEERKNIKQYPWKNEMGMNPGKYLLSKGLTVREKIKLIVMMLRV